MTRLNHSLRAFVPLALFVCLAQDCGKSDSPTADPEPFKAAVAWYLEQNNMAMALKQMGVSNFKLEQLQRLWLEGGETPC